MRAAKRDKNEREFVEAWRALGALWIPQGENAGFDGLLVTPACEIIFVEVKDLRASHNKFYLTDNERASRARLLDKGQRYEVVTNMEQALKLVGAE